MNLPPRRRLSVLVADDSLPRRSYLRALINQEPGLCLAAEADTGATAIGLFFRFRPHIVLVHVCLPDSGGFDVLQCVKQAIPECVVIVLSAAPDPCVEEVSRMLGATEVCHMGSGLNPLREALARAQRWLNPATADGSCHGSNPTCP